MKARGLAIVAPVNGGQDPVHVFTTSVRAKHQQTVVVAACERIVKAVHNVQYVINIANR